MKNKRTPDIRFLEFTGNWEDHKLKDVANFIRGSFPQPYTNPDWYDEENGRPFVQVADIGFDLKLNKDTKLHISKVAEPKSRFVEAGKVVVALQGSIETSIGRVAITQYAAFFDRTILIFESYKTEIDNHYFAQVIQKLFQREKEKAWGATISTITKEALSDFVIGVPNIEEQTKIGNFLKQLDDTIALHQQELTTLKQTKQGFLQKMFPKEGEAVPEVRFPGFTGDWKQCKLGEILKVNSGRDYKHLQQGNIPVYGTGGYMLSVNDKLSDEDAIGIGRKGTIDKPQLLKAPFWTVDTLFYMTTKEKNDLLFCYSLANKIHWKRYDESTGVPSLSKSSIDKISINIPTSEEQSKIGNFFKQLDDTISLHQRELEALKETKKAFLQKMFV